eukprot:SAG31_NODE_8474_length_1444_cov_13.220998_2_plen_194_part_00
MQVLAHTAFLIPKNYSITLSVHDVPQELELSAADRAAAEEAARQERRARTEEALEKRRRSVNTSKATAAPSSSLNVSGEVGVGDLSNVRPSVSAQLLQYKRAATLIPDQAVPWRINKVVRSFHRVCTTIHRAASNDVFCRRSSEPSKHSRGIELVGKSTQGIDFASNVCALRKLMVRSASRSHLLCVNSIRQL